MEGQQHMVLWIAFAAGMACMVVLAAIYVFIRRTAYLNPVKRELKKEKQWLRRGEYNAAMVKGRQNLELLLKLVANNNGIQLDNTAQAVANAKSIQEKNGGQKNRWGSRRVMTYQQFGWWMEENGYLDRVAKWELNEVRLIGNKAVHENFISKEDAWNQYNYLEDILKTVSEKHPGHGRKSSTKKGQGGTRRQDASNGRSGQAKGAKAQGKSKKQGAPKKQEASQKQEAAKKKGASSKQGAAKKTEASPKQGVTKKPEASAKQASAKKPETSAKQGTAKRPEASPKPGEARKPEASAKQAAKKPEASPKQGTGKKQAASQKQETAKKQAASPKQDQSQGEKTQKASESQQTKKKKNQRSREKKKQTAAETQTPLSGIKQEQPEQIPEMSGADTAKFLKAGTDGERQSTQKPEPAVKKMPGSSTEESGIHTQRRRRRPRKRKPSGSAPGTMTAPANAAAAVSTPE